LFLPRDKLLAQVLKGNFRLPNRQDPKKFIFVSKMFLLFRLYQSLARRRWGCPPAVELLQGWLALLAAFFLAANRLHAAPGADDGANFSTWHMVKVPPDATNGLGTWIWAHKTFDRQNCRLWKEFDIPAGAKVRAALLRMTADNGYQFFLDGRELGQGADWHALTEYDLSLLLKPGHHVLAVDGFNDFFQAGVIMGLQIKFADGKTLEIKSDESWRVVPDDERDWENIKHPRPDWESAKLITSTNRAPDWNDPRWPLDFVSVPRFLPTVIPFWQSGWFHLLLAFSSGIIFMACFWLTAQLLIHNQERRLLNLERSRIARDIHDDVGTRLTKLVLQGEVAQSTQPADSNARRQFDQICEGLRGVLGAMDEVLWAVNPRHDTLANFIAYICDYAQTFLQNTKIQCLLEVEPDMPPLNFDLPLRRSLLLVVKEALNNAAKHSNASRLKLKIFRNNQKLVVVVEDNGCGFDLNQPRQNRNGLANFSKRISEAGGEYRMVTRPGEGCRVEFSIPLTRRSTRNWFLRQNLEPDSRVNFSETAASPRRFLETEKPPAK
jgi:signal transduction histidine kinase